MSWNTTASSMCEVANTILDSNIVKAINMPLSATVKDIYNITLKKIKSMGARKRSIFTCRYGVSCFYWQ